MRLAEAKTLHNGDEVLLKETGEVCKVISAYMSEDAKAVLIECCTNADGFTTLTHRDVK